MMKKDFSIMKWFIFPLLALGCSIGIAYASISMFGLDGSVLYCILLLLIVFISVILVFQTGNEANKAAQIAAFAFETIGIIALIITCIVGVYTSRNLSGMRASASDTNTQIESIAKLKSSKAQASLVKTSQIKIVDIGEETKRAEKQMLFPLIFEVSNYFIGLLVVFGINLFWKSKTPPTTQTPEPTTRARNGASLSLATAQAPFTNSTSQSHTVDNGNGCFLTLAQAGTGIAIRFRKTPDTAQHVLRITSAACTDSNLYAMGYKQLASWVLLRLEDTNKTYKPVYAELKETLV